MPEIKITDTKIIKYEFEVPIKRAAKDIWSVLVSRIDAWWMPDFRALGNDSVMSLRPEIGGGLTETSPDGNALEWYRVQMATRDKSLYLVGYMAPDWGGPTVSMLKLAVESRGEFGALIVSDALLGNVTESSGQSAAEGWQVMFGESFKKHAEA